MRLLIVSSCTSRKTVTVERPLVQDDFFLGQTHRARREAELAPYATRADALYAGDGHVRLMRAIEAVRADPRSRLTLDHWIVSAAYGVISGDTPILPYDLSFKTMSIRERRRWGTYLNVPAAIRTLLASTYDLCVLLLGTTHLQAASVDASVVPAGPVIAFTSKDMLPILRRVPRLRPVLRSVEDAHNFPCPLLGIKGEYTRRLFAYLERTGSPAHLLVPSTDIRALLAAFSV